MPAACRGRAGWSGGALAGLVKTLRAAEHDRTESPEDAPQADEEQGAVAKAEGHGLCPQHAGHGGLRQRPKGVDGEEAPPEPEVLGQAVRLMRCVPVYHGSGWYP